VPVTLAKGLDRVAAHLRLLLQHVEDRDVIEIGRTMLGDVRLARRLVLSFRQRRSMVA